jgi:dihydrofolate synthase / folylpolyglutamate synthase
MSISDAMIARFLALHPKSVDLSLGRILVLLGKLGNPQDKLPPVIHVAGTNGKGSTIAFMRAILEAGGLSVHVDTSPHLVRFNERIRLGHKNPGHKSADGQSKGRLVRDEVLADALARCEKANSGDLITFWEIVTAAAFLLFSEQPADVLLLETGLGGRLDATNVIKAPAAAVITSIGMDHADYLGNSLALIAAEKAGIFKRGCPAVIAPQDYPVAQEVLTERAEAAGAVGIRIGGQDFAMHEEAGRFVYQDTDGLLDLPRPRLFGRHQIINAGTAIAGLRAAGFGHLPLAAYEQGMLTADWPARLQRLKHGALVELAPQGAEIWLDGGHNADGGRVLAAAMADLQDKSRAPLIMISGLLSTKDVHAVLGPFVGLAQELIAVPIPGQLATRPAQEVADAAQQLGIKASISTSVEQALRVALSGRRGSRRQWNAAGLRLSCAQVGHKK